MADYVSFNHFPEYADAITRVLGAIVDETADALVHAIQDFMYINRQVDTGNMVNSVAKEDGEDAVTKNITIGAYYWIYQNYGTRYIPARPFLEPAVALIGPEFAAKGVTIEARLKGF